MRRTATTPTPVNVATLQGYHHSVFESLKAFVSDRIVSLTGDYTVSESNSESTKKNFKPGSHLALIGIELETVSGIKSVSETVLVNVLKMVFDKAGFHDDFFRIEADCTVDAECVSQTFTKAWLRNNYKAFKAMYEYFARLEITTNSERVGMHVNLDLANFGGTREEQIENVRKMGFIINKHYDLFRIALNRLGDNTWCPRMPYTAEYWKNTQLYAFNTSHSGCCVNMGHINAGRVEIRLVGGQKNYPCFRNTMETVFHLIDRVKKISWKDCEDVAKVFKGCNSYVFDRLSTNCHRAGTITEAELDAIRPTVKEARYL